MLDQVLITYTIRISTRAKRLHIKINRLAQVEVVSPPKVTKAEIDSFVQSNILWIERHTNRILADHKQDETSSIDPPGEIYFPLLEQTYHVRYLPDSEHNKFTIKDSVVNVFFDCDEEKRNQLQKFIQRIAKLELPEMLDKISDDVNLPYNRVFIKAQKTRWGSCSSKKNINLNRNLLFLKPEQVEYLMVHELCHTVHLNHSPRYWKFVSSFIPGYKEIDKSLRKATSKVPLWALV
ncbi:MAG: M48 family metallopeptidase [Gammaproteobacteria bacterium]|nr:M48 family metallopeptidase [Gammaproteobacteria bacterium]